MRQLSRRSFEFYFEGDWGAEPPKENFFDFFIFLKNTFFFTFGKHIFSEEKLQENIYLVLILLYRKEDSFSFFPGVLMYRCKIRYQFAFVTETK